MKFIIWSIVIFGLYTGWCWLPAQMTPSQIESGLVNILEALDHTSPDSIILDRTWKAVDSKGLYVAPKDIDLERERRPGERIVDIRFEIPVKVDWLGSERTLMRPVHVTHSYRVSESAESNRLAQIDEQRDFERRQNQLARRHLDDYQDRVRRECAKGNEYVQTTSVFVTFSDGTTQNVPCSAANSW